MDRNNKNIKFQKDGVHIIESSFFSIQKTVQCGQCFRWDQCEDGIWKGIVFNQVITVEQHQDHIVFCGVTKEDWQEHWEHYFDWNSDYTQLDALYRGIDPWIDNALNFGRGIRILNQPFWETLISFVISANNNIPRIQGLIEKICAVAGASLGEGIYGFPTPDALATVSETQLRSLGFGYRAPYIAALAQQFHIGQWKETDFKNGTVDEVRKKLLMLPGVGPKVADCILLFSLHRLEAFPVDTWVRKALNHIENHTEAHSLFTEKLQNTEQTQGLGYLQQMLFFAMRSEQRRK